MSEFELVTITYSFVLGLGVAQILIATSAVLRDRHVRPLHWLPLGFAASIFFLHIQYWFALFDISADLITVWTWRTYGGFLLAAVLLFLSGGLVLPTPGAGGAGSLIEDFEENGRLSLLFLAAYILVWVPGNAWANGSWLDVSVWFNVSTLVPLLLAYFAKGPRIRNAGALRFFLLEAFGLAFVWSTPSDMIGP